VEKKVKEGIARSS